MSQPNNSRGCRTTLDQDSSLIAVVEMSQSSWLVAGIVPGISRQPATKLKPDQTALLGPLRRWRNEAAKAGRGISRRAVAFEAGRDGFWLARWPRARGIEAYVIHATSIAVSHEHRRAKTDRWTPSCSSELSSAGRAGNRIIAVSVTGVADFGHRGE